MEEKKPSAPYAEPLTSAQEIEQAIEAILFAAGHPIRYDKLAEVLGLPQKDIKNIVREMAAHFEEENTNHGILLLLYPTACQLTTKEKYAPYIREALGIRRGGNLSASSMEVLAVVAYNQPVTRSFVDLVRGVDSSYAVNSLLDKGLIEAAGRLDAPGRPMLYVTTDKFLRVFGIHSLEELPQTEALSVAAAQLEETPEADSEAASEEEAPPAGEYTEPVDPEENGLVFEAGSAPAAEPAEAEPAEAEPAEAEEPLAKREEELP